MPGKIMTYSPKCSKLVKKWESLRLKAYLCPGGIWTLGYGHTAGVKPGDCCTVEQADRWCDEDLEVAAAVVASAVDVPLTQGQFDALTSFVLNVGPGVRNVKDGFVRLKNGQPSTMRRDLNVRNYPGAAAEFEKWVYGGGKKLGGLVSRRQEEKELFQWPPEVANATD